MRTSDSTNAIIYEDPNNEISGSFSCSTGGTLAIGGWWCSGTRTFNGATYNVVVEGDIVVQNGVSCWFSGSSHASADASELYGHELGE
jgi:hypothetical protein